MKDGKFDLKTFLDNIELYISAVLFIALTVLLFANVFCRYALKHSFAWVEEVDHCLCVDDLVCHVCGCHQKKAPAHRLYT